MVMLGVFLGALPDTIMERVLIDYMKQLKRLKQFIENPQDIKGKKKEKKVRK